MKKCIYSVNRAFFTEGPSWWGVAGGGSGGAREMKHGFGAFWSLDVSKDLLRGVLYWLLSLTQHHPLPISKAAEERRNLITLRSQEAWQNVFILAAAQTVDYCSWLVFKVKRSCVHLQVWGKPGVLCGICKCLHLRWANILPSRCALRSVRNEMATDKCKSPFIWMKQSTVFLIEV